MSTTPHHSITAFGDTDAIDVALAHVASWAHTHDVGVSEIHSSSERTHAGDALADITLTEASPGLLRLALREASRSGGRAHLVWRHQSEYLADNTVTVIAGGIDTTMGSVLVALPVVAGWLTISAPGTGLYPGTDINMLLTALLTDAKARYLWVPPPWNHHADTHLWAHLDTIGWLGGPGTALLGPTPGGLAAAMTHILPSDVYGARGTCDPLSDLLTGDGRAHAGALTGSALGELVLLKVVGPPRSVAELADWKTAGAYLARHIEDASWDSATKLAAVAAASVNVTTPTPGPNWRGHIRAYHDVATVAADLFASTEQRYQSTAAL